MATFDPIRITGIISQNVSTPRKDGTPGSALYNIPFQLSQAPPFEWAEHFPHAWDHPSSWSSRHRPGICRISGDVVWLEGTTIEEVEQVHKATLKLALDETNQWYTQLLERKDAEAKRLNAERIAHAQHVSELANKMKFD